MCMIFPIFIGLELLLCKWLSAFAHWMRRKTLLYLQGFQNSAIPLEISSESAAEQVTGFTSHITVLFRSAPLITVIMYHSSVLNAGRKTIFQSGFSLWNFFTVTFLVPHTYNNIILCFWRFWNHFSRLWWGVTQKAETAAKYYEKYESPDYHVKHINDRSVELVLVLLINFYQYCSNFRALFNISANLPITA